MKNISVFLLVLLFSKDLFGQSLDSSSVKAITSEEFNTGIINSIDQAVAGMIPSLMASRPGANPNQPYAMLYRGFTTMRGEQAPKYFLEGILINAPELVDPNLMSEVSVANGTQSARYGFLAGAGIVEVQGHGNQIKENYIEVGQQFGIEHYSSSYEVLSAQEFRSFNEGDFDFGDETNWLEEVSQTGFASVSSLRAGYKKEALSVSTAISFRDVPGIQKATGFNQLSFLNKASYSLWRDRLSISSTLFYTQNQQDFGDDDIFHAAVGMNPTQSTDATVQYFTTFGGNPVSRIERATDSRENILLGYNGSIDFKMTENFSINSAISHSRLKQSVDYFSDEIQSLVAELNENEDRWLRSLSSISYTDQLSDRLKFSIGSFVEYQRFESDETNYISFDFNSPESNSYLNADTLYGEFSSNSIGFEASLISNRFHLNLLSKWEQSANFGADTDRAIFFGAEASQLINDWLTIRSSFSKVGLYPLRAGVAQVNIQKSYFGDGPADFELRRLNNANPNLKWENTTTFDLGADLSMLDRKLFLGLNYFQSRSSDLIDYLFVGPPLGPSELLLRNFPTPVNFAAIDNQGWEFTIRLEELEFGAFRYSSFTNINFLSSRWSDLSFEGGTLNENALPLSHRFGFYGQYQFREGKEIASIYLPEFLGINSDGSWNVIEDYTAGLTAIPTAGQGIPNWFLGSRHQLRYKKWSISAFLEGAFGHSIFNETRLLYQTTVDGPTNRLANTRGLEDLGLDQFNSYSDYFLERAGFLRMSYLSMGRSFDFEESSIIKQLNFSFVIQNLFTISNYSGPDPTVRLAHLEDHNYGTIRPGIDQASAWLPSRTFSLAINARF